MTFNLADIQIDVVDSAEKAHEMLKWAGDVRTPVMSVDVETDGLQWYDGKLKLVQFGTMTQGWAIPFDLYPGLAREALKVVDEERKLPLTGHNFHFDLHFLERHTGWVPKNWGRYHDTLLAASVLESSGPKGLKELSFRHVTDAAKGGQVALAQAMKQGGWNWATVPTLLEPYWVYGVLDTILGANLLDVLLPRVHASGCLEAYEVERACVPALYSMERRGMLVDAEHCNEQIAFLQAEMEEVSRTAFEDYGIESIGSGDQLIRAFLDAGVELRTKTGKGRYSMSREAFEELEAREGKHPLVALVSRYRKAEKFCSAYYENFLKYQCSDGRVHPQYKQSVARTGRMSAQYPAIQTIPRPGTKEDPEHIRMMSTAVRNAFVTEEGHSYISTDFTNIEARIFAHFAKEQGMLDAIRRNIDLHGYTAQQVYQQWPEQGVAPKDHALRQVAKSVLFCMLFGGGPSKVAVTAGVPEEEALEAFNGVHRAFPGIKQFMKSVERMAKDNYESTGRAWVRGIDGRILMLNENDDRFYAFTNYLIQGTATVLLKQRLGVIHNMGLDEYCVAAIHDEVVAEVPDEDVEDFQKAIAEAMLDETQFAVPALAEPGDPAKRLGEAK
jgi:DNA polymerase-1